MLYHISVLFCKVKICSCLLFIKLDFKLRFVIIFPNYFFNFC